jgi:very-short-patch-repair endonuclease
MEPRLGRHRIRIFSGVTAAQLEIDRILQGQGGLICRRHHPDLIGSIDAHLASGRLVRLLPGIYAVPEAAELPLVRCSAGQLWEPNAVLTHHAAAWLTFWPNLRLAEVHLATRHREGRRPGYVIDRRIVPTDFVVVRHGLRCTAPALTALDLVDHLGGEAIDVLLRSRQATLQHLHEALAASPYRRGNKQRRQIVLESRENPWSPPERLAHRLLREAGITGWVGNLRVVVCGHLYYLDIGFPDINLAVEIDGRDFHSSPADFERDRWRQNDLVNAGWRVLRFTAQMLDEAPHLVLAVIAEALTG